MQRWQARPPAWGSDSIKVAASAAAQQMERHSLPAVWLWHLCWATLWPLFVAQFSHLAVPDALLLFVCINHHHAVQAWR